MAICHEIQLHKRGHERKHTRKHTSLYSYMSEHILISCLSRCTWTTVLKSASPILFDFSVKCSVIILLQFSEQPIITALLAYSVSLQETERASWHPVFTHPPSTPHTHPPQTHWSTNTQVNTQVNRQLKTNRKPWRAKIHRRRKANWPGYEWAMDLGLGLARVERGTISCPNASVKSTLWTRANIFPPR